jgi:hypothetical protein
VEAAVSDSTHPLRSYQRIFKPDRRVYAIDGRRLPVPGGVPLEWLCWAFCSLIAVLVLSQHSFVVAGTVAALVGLLAASSHGWTGAVLGVLAGFAATLLAGVALDWLDWPLRLLVVPGMIAGRPPRAQLSDLARRSKTSSNTPDTGRRDRRGAPGAAVGAAGVGRPRSALAGSSPRPRQGPGKARVRAPGCRCPRPGPAHHSPRRGAQDALRRAAL